MFEKSNEEILSSVADLLAKGKIDPEGAGKLLNTIARFEERSVEVDQTTKSRDRVD